MNKLLHVVGAAWLVALPVVIVGSASAQEKVTAPAPIKLTGRVERKQKVIYWAHKRADGSVEWLAVPVSGVGVSVPVQK